ncbi:MAG: hypothetical protein ACREOI_24265 [bacterium]
MKFTKMFTSELLSHVKWAAREYSNICGQAQIKKLFCLQFCRRSSIFVIISRQVDGGHVADIDIEKPAVAKK